MTSAGGLKVLARPLDPWLLRRGGALQSDDRERRLARSAKFDWLQDPLDFDSPDETGFDDENVLRGRCSGSFSGQPTGDA